MRHGARSIAEITKDHLGTGAGRAMILFIWIVLIYVIIAFTQMTAGTFVSALTNYSNRQGARLCATAGCNTSGVLFFASLTSVETSTAASHALGQGFSSCCEHLYAGR